MTEQTTDIPGATVLPLQAAELIADEARRAPDKPGVYRMIAADGEVLYVGDNLAHDIVPPVSIGMHTAWIRRAAREGQDVEAANPEFIVNDFRELATILRERFQVPLEEF